MAMGNISAIGRNIPVQAPEQTSERARATELEVKQPQEAAGEREKKIAEDFGHPDADSVTVGRSVDGDTSRASRIGIENAREGIVLKKGESAERGEAVSRTEPDINTSIGEEKSALAKEEDAQKDKPSKPMTGYTDTQIEQMYDQGRISRQDYDQEMDRRERIAEEAGMAEKAEEKEENPVIKEAKEASVDQAQNEIKAEKQDNERQEVKNQEKETDKTNEENAGETRKQLITEEMENDKEFNARMSEINTQQQDFSLKADGIVNAIANDREELFQNVMEAAQKVAATEPTQ